MLNQGKVSLCIYLDSQVERGRRPARDTQCAGLSPEKAARQRNRTRDDNSEQQNTQLVAGETDPTLGAHKRGGKTSC